MYVDELNNNLVKSICTKLKELVGLGGKSHNNTSPYESIGGLEFFVKVHRVATRSNPRFLHLCQSEYIYIWVSSVFAIQQIAEIEFHNDGDDLSLTFVVTLLGIPIQKIRLALFDTPEKGQAFGVAERAQKHLQVHLNLKR
jgi:endonuclease YncB( thermonuclease family)